MSGILFFIFASCHPLIENRLSWNEMCCAADIHNYNYVSHMCKRILRFELQLRGVLTLNIWNLSTAVTFNFLPCHILSIHFWKGNEPQNLFLVSSITKNDDCLRKSQKITFFGSKFLWQANKNILELKMPKFLEKTRKDPCLGMDFLFFNLISYFSNFWQKSAKNVFFLEKNQNFGSFFVIIRKI